MVLLETLQRYLLTGWLDYEEDVVPTRTTADDPTFILTFTGIDLTDFFFASSVEGIRIRWTQNSIVRHGIITAHSFSTNSTLTILTRMDNATADYDVLDTTTYPITDIAFSSFRFPDGFPTNEVAFSAVFSDTTQRTPSATDTDPANVFSASVAVPIGLWIARVEQSAYVQRPGGTGIGFTNGLSTANNTLPDKELIWRVDGNWPSGTGSVALTGTKQFSKRILLSSKTTYYWNHLETTVSNSPVVTYRNDQATFKLIFVSAYF